MHPKENAKEDDHRIVVANGRERNATLNFCSNFVTTSRYTWFTFIPKFFCETFRKVANAYFLLVSFLQSIPSISTTGGVPATLQTLSFIVMIDAIFAIMEDRKRHRADAMANARVCHVLDPTSGTFVDTTWAQVKVGDVLMIRNYENLPADVVILATSEPDEEHQCSGMCYVETKSLDGETNLKLREALECTMSDFRTPKDLMGLCATVACEHPNNGITKFSGTFTLHRDDEKDDLTVPISPDSILLRGCIFRNTEWAYGLVLNTGQDTKIMMSNVSTPTKASSMDALIDHYILGIVFFLLLCCMIGATCSVVWNEAYANVWYLGFWKPDFGVEWTTKFFYFFLLMYQFIPISLYVSMSMVKYYQAQLMQLDGQMYHVESDTPMAVRTMNLNEELGQISYLFSDKTGTLTCNVMDFRKCSIGGMSYGHGTTEIGLAALKLKGQGITDDDEHPPNPLTRSSGGPAPQPPFVNFDSPELFHALNNTTPKTPQDQAHRDTIVQFFTHLALCHTIIPETREGSDEVVLSASSPDEQALVAGAQFVGFQFCHRAPGQATIQTRESTVPETYDILDILEFNSTRKRMSVIVRDPQGRYQLYCKGADTVILPRLKTDPNQSSSMIKDTCAHMDIYAAEGLRTLMITTKTLDEAMYLSWSKDYVVAMGNLDEIEKRKDGEKNAIDDLMERIECDLELLGVTAIEDKLQEDVPDTILTLAEAGIKIWVLTGDKEETAINIGFACQLLHRHMEQVILNLDLFPDGGAIAAELEALVLRREYELRQHLHSGDKSPTMEKISELALIVDGEVLEFALVDARCRKLLLTFGQMCKAVIACRVSPSQKADLVALIKNNVPDARTMAIGDGANDVSMIQQAHVGVGISGQEGLQAVSASDYAIARFKFLKRLVLVHGRWNYNRMSILVGYMFYKNIMLTAAQYWYIFSSGYSGQNFYLEAGLQIYNILLTALPIIGLGVLERDVSETLLEKFPKLYAPGPTNAFFNSRIFAHWILSAILESIGITYLVLPLYNNADESGRDPGLYLFGFSVFTLVVIVANMKLMLRQRSWVWFTAPLYLASICFWFLLASLSSEWHLLGGFHWRDMLPSASIVESFWLQLVLVPVALLLVNWAGLAYQVLFFPEYHDLAREVDTFALDQRLLEWDDPQAQVIPLPFDFKRQSSGRQPPPRRASHPPVPEMVNRKLANGFAFSIDPRTVVAETSHILRHRKPSMIKNLRAKLHSSSKVWTSKKLLS